MIKVGDVLIEHSMERPDSISIIQIIQIRDGTDCFVKFLEIFNGYESLCRGDVVPVSLQNVNFWYDKALKAHEIIYG
jgi:cold shock CspA family protein